MDNPEKVIKVYNCWTCNCVVPDERAQILLEMGVDHRRITCVKHSEIKPIKGIWDGEVGTSKLILCTKVYNDSVRSKFREIEEITENLPEDVDE